MFRTGIEFFSYPFSVGFCFNGQRSVINFVYVGKWSYYVHHQSCWSCNAICDHKCLYILACLLWPTPQDSQKHCIQSSVSGSELLSVNQLSSFVTSHCGGELVLSAKSLHTNLSHKSQSGAAKKSTLCLLCLRNHSHPSAYSCSPAERLYPGVHSTVISIRSQQTFLCDFLGRCRRDVGCARPRHMSESRAE